MDDLIARDSLSSELESFVSISFIKHLAVFPRMDFFENNCDGTSISGARGQCFWIR